MKIADCKALHFKGDQIRLERAIKYRISSCWPLFTAKGWIDIKLLRFAAKEIRHSRKGTLKVTFVHAR